MRRSVCTLLLPAIVAASLAGCAIDLVSKYDAATDEAAAAMQKDFATFFTRIVTATSDTDRSFGANQDFYRHEVVALGALTLRADNIPKNQLTRDQIKLLRFNLALLALQHKGCLTRPLDDARRAVIEDKGVDPSVRCRTEYGADVEATDRSASLLNPVLVPGMQDAFDRTLGAIMRLEIAKKRGETGKTE